MAISKNLITLADGATRKETMCLERVVKEWIKSKEIDDNVIKVLWECFTGKLPDAKVVLFSDWVIFVSFYLLADL